jgi:carboxylesterase
MPLLPGAEPFSHDGGHLGVLLCHGFTGTPQSLRPWADYLAARDVSVRLPRLPGHGTTWQDMRLTRWTDWYAAVERAFDELRERCDSIVVGGLSMGGSLAIRIAQCRGAQVAGLALVNPALFSGNRLERALPLIKHVVPALAGPGNDIKKPGVTELAYDRMPLAAAASAVELWALVRRDLAQVTQPVLLLRSSTDHVLTPANAATLLATISSTDVEEVVLENSYHVATLDNDAETVFACSLDFLQRVTSATRTEA